MSIFKETFKGYVKRQMRIREAILSQGNNLKDNRYYYNSIINIVFIRFINMINIYIIYLINFNIISKFNIHIINKVNKY